MTAPERIRLFVAVSIPRGHLEAIAGATAPVRERFPGGRWPAVENQHVTLKFLGSTPAAVLPDVEDVCTEAAASAAPVEVRLGPVGSFPSATRMRVLWVGLEDEAGMLPRVATALDEGFVPLGFRVEKRGFTPHLTLARFKAPVRVTEPLPEIATPELPPFTIDAIELFRSHLSPKGARYEVLRSFPFGS